MSLAFDGFPDPVRLTQAAAIAAARYRGRGDEQAADRAAIAAMQDEANRLAVRGIVAIGEGEAGASEVLYSGEHLGAAGGPAVDFGLDPLDGATLCARNQPNALAVAVIAGKGALLALPETYMEKIAIGPGYPAGTVALELSPAENIARLSKAKGVSPAEIGVCILDRPRHGRLIEAVRAAGARIRLIGDGDIAGVLFALDPARTGVDLYLGVGGAREGALAAAALRCVGGAMEGRLVLDSAEKRANAARLGFADPHRLFTAEDMTAGELRFSASAVTDSPLLAGVIFGEGRISVSSIAVDSGAKTLRRSTAELADTVQTA